MDSSMVESAFDDGGASSDNFSPAPKAVRRLVTIKNKTNKPPLGESKGGRENGTRSSQTQTGPEKVDPNHLEAQGPSTKKTKASFR